MSSLLSRLFPKTPGTSPTTSTEPSPTTSAKPREGTRHILIKYADVVGIDADGVLMLSDETELEDPAAPMGQTAQQILQEAVDAEYRDGGPASLRVILEVRER